MFGRIERRICDIEAKLSDIREILNEICIRISSQVKQGSTKDCSKCGGSKVEEITCCGDKSRRYMCLNCGNRWEGSVINV